MYILSFRWIKKVQNTVRHEEIIYLADGSSATERYTATVYQALGFVEVKQYESSVEQRNCRP
jgi:hypothetical protein